MSGFHLKSARSKQFNLAESKVLAIDSNSTNVKHFHAHSSCHIEWANVYVVDFQINFVIVLTPFLLFYLRYIDIFTWDKREKRLAKNQNWWKSFDMEQQRLNIHVHVIWLHANWKVSLLFFRCCGRFASFQIQNGIFRCYLSWELSLAHRFLYWFFAIVSNPVDISIEHIWKSWFWWIIIELIYS